MSPLAASTGVQRTELDLTYVSAGSAKQRLDLYLPAGNDFPTVLFVHGGSLTSGDRKDAPYGAMCRAFAAAGLGCATTSYRLFPSVRWPAPAEDVAAAFKWLRDNVADRGGDPDRITLFGHSSGCLIATLIGTDPRYLRAHGLSPRDVFAVIAMGCRLNEPAPDTSGVDPARVQRYFGSDPFGSRFGNLEALRSYRPMTHVGPHMPPFLVLIAERERFKPPILEDAAAFVGKARDCRVDADLAILSDRTHKTAVERLANRDDPAFIMIRKFIQRLSLHGPATHQADVSLCPTS